jgi:hypothetical protein
MLFVKDIPAFREIIDRYAYKYINAYNFSFRRNVIDKAVSENKEGVKNEIIRKMNEEPEGFVINIINRNYWGKVK